MKTKKPLLIALTLILTILPLLANYQLVALYEDGTYMHMESTSVTSELIFEHVIIDSTDYANVRSIADVDGDGFFDIIAAKEGSGLTWYKYPNWTKYSIRSFNWLADDVHSADIDGDGDIDIVGAQDNDGKVYWYENPRPGGNPADTWASHYIGISNGLVKDLEIADFNRDGKLDVVTRKPTAASVFLQNSPSSWTKVKSVTFQSVVGNTANIDGLDVGDLDGDGDLDLVLNGFWVETPSDLAGGSWIEHNIDSKWWTQNTGGWQDNNAKVRVVDINADSRLDVLISQSEKPGYPVSWYEASNPKSGPWTEHVIGYSDYCHTLQAGDMDNDGDIDVVAGKFERPDGAIPPPYPLRVYRNNNGDGLSWNVTEVSDLGIYTGVIGDIGNDGDLDIVGSRSYWKGPVEIWENTVNNVDVYPVYLFLTVEPNQASYARGQSVTLTVNVFSQLNTALNSTLTLTVAGPSDYYFDFQTISVAADAVSEYSCSWVVPDLAGTYVVEVSLVPPQLTAYDTVWLMTT